MNADYTCNQCGNQVLYLRDHKPDCIHYVNPYTEPARNN